MARRRQAQASEPGADDPKPEASQDAAPAQPKRAARASGARKRRTAPRRGAKSAKNRKSPLAPVLGWARAAFARFRPGSKRKRSTRGRSRRGRTWTIRLPAWRRRGAKSKSAGSGLRKGWKLRAALACTAALLL